MSLWWTENSVKCETFLRVVLKLSERGPAVTGFYASHLTVRWMQNHSTFDDASTIMHACIRWENASRWLSLLPELWVLWSERYCTSLGASQRGILWPAVYKKGTGQWFQHCNTGEIAISSVLRVKVNWYTAKNGLSDLRLKASVLR